MRPCSDTCLADFKAVCARVCVRVCVCARVCVRVHAWVWVCVFSY